jgi:D-serine deaminase-like pyridoxal phosphate-dependent protein
MESAYPSCRDAVRGHRLPLAYVDLDRLRQNAAALVARARGLPLRLATKSVRVRSLLRLVLDEFPGFRGLMCFTAGEAAWLAREGFDDLLVAYPTVEPSELLEVADAVRGGRRLVLTVDDEAQLPALTHAAEAAGVRLGVSIELDMSSSWRVLHFGVRRSPLTTPAAVVALARAIRARPSLDLVGLMGYEAQIAGVPDAVRGQAPRNAVVRALKRRSMAEVARRREAAVAALRADGFALAFVNGGGTGSLEASRGDVSVTELTAGSGLFSPALFDGYAAFRHLPAAGFALPIVRVPGPGTYTCHGGGYVASGAAGRDKLPSVQLPEGARLLPLEGAGEVQTPVVYTGPVALAVGDPIFFRHAKAGELSERFDRVLLIEGGRAVGETPTYRGEGRCFL